MSWYESQYSSMCIDYAEWNCMVSSICHHGPDYISQVMPWGVSSSRISGQLLSLHSSRDINTWSSHNYNNSSLIWDESLNKFKAMKSGGGTGDLTQATADARYAGSSNVNRALINSISSNLDTRIDSIFNYSSNAKSLYAGSSQVSGRFYPSALGKSLMNFSANKSIYANSANVRFRFPGSSNIKGVYYPSSLGSKVSGSVSRLWAWSSNHAANWLDLTDGGQTALHSHAGGTGGGFPSGPRHSIQYKSGAGAYHGGNWQLTFSPLTNRFALTGGMWIKGSVSGTNISANAIRTNSIVGSVLSQFAGSTNIIYRFPGSSNLNRTMLNATSGSLHNLWNWSSNKSWYANSSNVRFRFQASSLARQSYLHSANQGIHSFNVINYITSTNAINRFYPSGIGKSTSGSVQKLWLWSSNKSWYAQSSNVRLRFPASSTAISRFADSANIRSKYRWSSAAGVNRWNYVSSQKFSGGAIQTDDLTVYRSIISGLIHPPYPSAAASKHYVDTISGALVNRFGSVSNTYVSTQHISGQWKLPLIPNVPAADSEYDGILLRVSGGTGGGANPWGSYANWDYRRAVQINGSCVKSSQTNFPILFKINDIGRNAALADGRDIVFTDSDGTTRLPHELISFANYTGNAWVKIPSLTHAQAKTFYMYWGNDSDGDQTNLAGYRPSSVWNDDFVFVCHMRDSGGTTANDSKMLVDSTKWRTPLYKGTAGVASDGTDPQMVKSFLGSAQRWDTGSHYSISSNTTNGISLLKSGLTLEVLVSGTGIKDSLGYVIGIHNKPTDSNFHVTNLYLGNRGTNYTYWMVSSDNYKNIEGSESHPYWPSTNIAHTEMFTGTWKSGNTVTAAAQTCRIESFWGGNKISDLANEHIGNLDTNMKGIYIGQRLADTARAFSGSILDIRLSRVKRNNGWVKTTSYNISSLSANKPTVFYSMGSNDENPGSTGAAKEYVMICLKNTTGTYSWIKLGESNS